MLMCCITYRHGKGDSGGEGEDGEGGTTTRGKRADDSRGWIRSFNFYLSALELISQCVLANFNWTMPLSPPTPGCI